MNTKYVALFASLISLGALSAQADTITLSGTDLSGLAYRPNGGSAQYVAGAPDLAVLSTPDSGLSGGDPAVFVKLANTGFASLGDLDTFSASYVLDGAATGPDGTEPYWLTYLFAPGGGDIGIVSFGGADLNASSQVHVFYDYADAPLSSDTYWGDTLAELDATAYGTTTFGQLGVYETAVEIGDWDNGTNVIPASASIESLTISNSAPDRASALLLLGLGLAALAMLGPKQSRLQAAR